MYLVLIGGLFLVITLVSWSVYATTSVLNKDHILMNESIQITQNMVNKTELMVTSGLLGIPIHAVYTTQNLRPKSECVLNRDEYQNLPKKCYKLKDIKLTVNSKFQWDADANIDYATEDFMTDSINGVINNSVLFGGISVIVAGIISVICIICCCTGCCSCCCCKKHTSETVGLLRV
uniref:Uncharacterized protein n=1 Tax=Trepomonas sp. PC1 TaxID=1076344 RepID=A0A146K0N2_9EUKA|eukprot:JAP89334.1 Hypothetical protein TPC1_31171 [Trepomonas sp. PC1]